MLLNNIFQCSSTAAIEALSRMKNLVRKQDICKAGKTCSHTSSIPPNILDIDIDIELRYRSLDNSQICHPKNVLFFLFHSGWHEKVVPKATTVEVQERVIKDKCFKYCIASQAETERKRFFPLVTATLRQFGQHGILPKTVKYVSRKKLIKSQETICHIASVKNVLM